MNSLRSYLLATVSSVALIGGAAAADMPMKAPPIAPELSMWAGPYVGLNAGVAWNHSSFTDVDQFFFILPGGPNNNFWNNSNAGFTAGGLLGYNWQAGKFVYGVEGDLNWVDQKSSVSISSGPTVTVSSDLKWMGTLRARFGVTYDPATLLYVTGGLAVAQFSDLWGLPASGSRFTMSDNSTRAGWTIGGGVERMFSPHWTGRVEVLYADFGTKTVTDVDVAGTYRTKFEHTVTQARGALSYKW